MSVESVGSASPASSRAKIVRLPRHGGGTRRAGGGPRPCASRAARPLRAGATPCGDRARPRSTRRSATAARRSRSAVELRHMYRAETCDGMMFAAMPPSVTMPWTWSPGTAAGAAAPIATWAIVMASPALTPAHGAAEACASVPVKWTSKWSTARHVASRRSSGNGCTIIATSRPSNAPPSSIRILPPPPSSAGVPSTTTVAPTSSATRASPIAAPDRARRDDVVAARVPTVGSASYSAQSPMRTGPVPDVATNAVSSPQASRSTSKPAPLERRGDRADRVVLLERCLGVRVQVVAQLEQRARRVARPPRPPAPRRSLDHRHDVTRSDGVALGDAQLDHRARRSGDDRVLHLHRLEDADRLALLHRRRPPRRGP